MYDGAVRSQGRLVRSVQLEGRAWIVASWVLLGMLVIAGPHAVAAVHPWAMVMLTSVSWLALACTTLALGWQRCRLPSANWLGLALLAWTGIQALQLPCGLVSFFAPEAAEQARLSWALVSQRPLATCALSADPGNGREELVKWSGILCAYFAALLWARQGYGRRLITLVSWSAFAMAISALGHFAVDAQRVYGLYTPEHVGSAYLGPILNANCLGGFLVLGAGAQIGLTGPSATRQARSFYLVAAVLGTCVAVLTLSRGAMGAAMLLACLLGFRVLFRRGGYRSRGARMARIALPAVGLVGGAALAVWLAGEPISKAVSDRNVSKVLLWKHAWPVVWDHPWVGIGRGAFSAVFTRYYGSTERFVYPENFPLQWAAEWGLPVALALLGWLLVRMGMPLTTARTGYRYCTAAALLVYAVQNLFDIGLELMAPTLVAAVALAALRRRTRRSAGRAAFSPLALLLPVLLVLGFGGADVLHEDVRTLSAALHNADSAKQRSDSHDDYEALFRTAVRLHPQEVVFPYYAAGRALRLGMSSAPRLINRAMLLAPDWVGPHVLAARFLWARGRREQATIALRRAMALHPGLAQAAACGMAQQAPQLLTRILPSGPNVRAAIDIAGGCLAEDHPVRAELDRRLIDGFPDEVRAYVREAHRLQKTKGVEQAEAWLRAELARAPEKSDLWVELARLKLGQSQPTEALSLVKRGEKVGLTKNLLEVRLEALVQLGRAEEARKVWARLMAISPKDAHSLANLYALAGSMEERLGNLGRAMSAYMQAHRLDEQVDHLVHAANLAERIGERGQARRLWQRICVLDPQRAAACAKAETTSRAP